MERDHSLAFSRCLRAFGLVASLTALASCGNPASHWSRAGVTEAQRDADYAACRAEARSDSGERIDQDILSSRAAQSHGPGQVDAAPGSLSAGDADAASQGLIACMTDHGYQGK